jgi:chemotaxis protein histidine kinase CheA
MLSLLRPCLLVVLALSAWCGAAAPAWAQDPVEFGRLSSDQRQLAEQVRRLDKILSVLEARERKEGQQARAELLKQARSRLSNAGSDRPLSSVLEEVAADLNELRAGSALSQQAELVRFLEELLDFLLETERREQVQDLLQAALQREQALRQLAQQQAELRQRTESLEQAEQESGQRDQASRDELAQAQAELNEKIEALAEQAKESSSGENAAEAVIEGQQAEQELRSDPPPENQATPPSEPDATGQSESGSTEPAEPSEPESTEPAKPSEPGSTEPAKPSEPGSTEPAEPSTQPSENSDPSSPSQQQQNQQQLQQAQEHQKEAQEKLDQAADQAKQEAERLQNMDQLEALINVLEKAEELAERHARVERQLVDLVEGLEEGARVPRSARVKLRQWANEEKVLAEETDALMFEVREAGADSYPFLLRLLLEDHNNLAARLGPPKYRANLRAVSLSERISHDWSHLIEAIRLEMERIRRKLEKPDSPPGGDGEPEPEPLVGMAAEVQLLKLLQGDLRDDILDMKKLQGRMELAGIEMDADDLADLDFLVQRQQHLRTLFESILERMRQAQEEGGEEI